MSFLGMFTKKAAGDKKTERAYEAEAVAAPGELIAVITAAIAAYESGQGHGNLTVRKINRISGPAPAWYDAGRAECMDSRRI